MPKQKDIRGLLQKQVEDIEKKLTVSRASLVYYQTEVREQEAELEKSRNALSSLDGTLQNASAPYPFLSGMQEVPKLPARLFAAPTLAKPEIVTIDGEEVVLEQGFHVEKNSFGEDCIVPDGVKYAPAAEPVATPDTNARLGQNAIPLPAITSGDQFDSPEEIISGELPNG
jgi:hypothetical protein